MVRLKAFGLLVLGFPLLFQFQYGTIKSEAAIMKAEGMTAFQFQYGTIKRHQKDWQRIAEMQFQFQYGTIKRPTFAPRLRICSFVSIPIWYD